MAQTKSLFLNNEESFDNFLSELKARGVSFYIRNSAVNKSRRLMFSYEQKNANIKIPFTGSPFTVVKTIYMSCSQDDEYHPRSKPTNESMADHSTCKKKRFLIEPTKKIGCPAFLTMKCIRIFDDYQLNAKSNQKTSAYADRLERTKILNDLERDLRSSSPPTGKLQYMIVMSDESVHSHSVVSANMKQILHPKIKEAIHGFEKQSICSVKTMKIHLEEVVERMFDGKTMPDKLNRCYYPSDNVIRFHMHRARFKIKKSKYDQEALEECIKTWRESSPGDNFFFRPYTDKNSNSMDAGEDEELQCSTILFCHQTEWQRDLLSRYGNNLSLLDTRYKTCKYSLPLFFVIVKTNCGYIIVGTFIVQSEWALLIAEALAIFQSWNPDWFPKYFLTDYSDAKINALEQTFPSSTVYLCAFHREQSWNRWLRKVVNVPSEAIAPLKKLWQQIAASPSADAFEENKQLMYDSKVYQKCESAQRYFSEEWLPISFRWVEAFHSPDFIFKVSVNNGIESQNNVLKYKYFETKDRTLAGVIRVILEFLPEAINKYTISNAHLGSDYKGFNKDMPSFLQNRPISFIEHVMSRYESGRNFPSATIFNMNDGTFVVTSGSETSEWYMVDFAAASCNCTDFSKWRLPCKHMCAVFINTQWQFHRLPLWYRENPYITIDLKYSAGYSLLEEPVAMDEPPPNAGTSNLVDAPETSSDENSTAVDVKNVLKQCREKLKNIINYTFLTYSDPESVMSASRTIDALEEHFWASADKPEEELMLLTVKP